MSVQTTETIRMIDGNYVVPERAAAYLIVDGDEAAFFDNITRFSVPDLLAELAAAGRAPEDVRWIIVSHVHLDHCGGTAELAKQCPNATIVCHPRAKRHIVDPSKLVEAATPIYGGEEVFASLFGTIEPVDEARVQELDDGATLELGKRTFNVIHTPGHARHHMSVYDRAANVVYAGDAFGLAQKRLQQGGRVHLSYVVSPPDFSAADAKESIRRIAATGADRVCVTHFGPVTDVKTAEEHLYGHVDALDAIIADAAATELEDAALLAYAKDRAEQFLLQEARQCGLDPNEERVRYWALAEINVTSQGIAYAASRRRSAVG